jgi:hypothetical protein
MGGKMSYEGYSWIKVKRYKMDESKTWEERYKDLDAHHIEETTFLINKVRELAQQMQDQKEQQQRWDCER